MGPQKAELSPEAPVERRLVHEIESVRGELGEVLSELDRRRQGILDVGARVRSYAWPVLLVGAGIAAAGGIAVGWARRRQARVGLLRRLAGGWQPQPVAMMAPPSVLRSVAVRALGTAASAVVGIFLNRLIERLWQGEEEGAYYDRRRQARGTDVRDMH